MLLRFRCTRLLVIVSVLAATACTQVSDGVCSGQTIRLRSPDTLTVGTDFSYPPFAFSDPDEERTTGLEVELLEAVAAELGLKLLLVSRSSSALVPDVLARRHDLAASGLRASDLQGEVCMSDPYLEADLGILVPAANPFEIESAGDLSDRSVGVLRGSHAAEWARRSLGEGTRVLRLETPEDTLTALGDGSVDAVVDDAPIVRHADRQSGDFRTAGVIDVDDHYVLAASTDNAPLIQAVNAALAKLHDEGTLSELRQRWVD